MNHRLHLTVSVVLLFVMILMPVAGASAGPPNDGEVSFADYELIGTINFPTGYMFEGTQMGGLSSITYDATRGVFYAISDDQSVINPARYYTLSIDLSDGQRPPLHTAKAHRL